ncbi:hypothetical protein [Lonepinella sp. MS14435]|uniref:hypothetical protein n=1 Tax=Lonepinella sp. MS14435 TaxID=3003618 RepID=UPI0036DD79E2
MKKLSLILATLALGACTTVITNDNPVEARSDLKEVCIQKNTNDKIPEFSNYLKNSLVKKGLKAKVISRQEQCPFRLTYNITVSHDSVQRGKFYVFEGRQKLASLGYKRRAEEKVKVRETGAQGQADLIVNTLFRNF